jgi:hypothetical protein
VLPKYLRRKQTYSKGKFELVAELISARTIFTTRTTVNFVTFIKWFVGEPFDYYAFLHAQGFTRA